MNKNLLDNNYLIIPNFISPYKCNKLKEEFKQFSEINNLSGDEQSPNSQCFYNYLSFLELLCEKTPEISNILGETVLPTYSYSRIYKNGSTLKPHVDRESCEISLTLHLGGDNSWPIYIKSPNDDDICIILNPGDAIMYLGCDAIHWREKYEGDEYVQVFLHYVRSRGDKSSFYFDKKNTEVNKIDLNPEKEENNNIESETNKKIIPKEEEREIFFKSRPNNTLESFVEVFDDVLSEEYCNLILQEYENSLEFKNAQIQTDENSVSDDNIRNCSIIPISSYSTFSENKKIIDDIIYESISHSKKLYEDKHGNLNVNNDSGYDLLKYESGQFYKQHIDASPKYNRILSCSIQLNDDYVGGEFSLFNEEMLIRTKKGSIIMFPSNFMYPHEIKPIISGIRYSIVTWLL